MSLLLAAVGARWRPCSNSPSSRTCGSARRSRISSSSSGSSGPSRSARGRSGLGLRRGARPRHPRPAAARLDSLRAAALLSARGASSAGSSAGSGRSSRSSPRPPESRLLDDPVVALDRAPLADPGRRPDARSFCPARCTTRSSPPLVGPLAVSIHDRRADDASGSTGDGVPRRPAEARSARLSGSSSSAGRRSSASAASRPGSSTSRSSTAASLAALATQQPDRPRGDPVAARPDLRPQGPAARHERPDVGGQDPARPICRSTERDDGRRPASPPCSGMTRADINAAIDSNPGSRFDLVRIAGTSPRTTARLISEAGDDLPGVEVVVEARRAVSGRPAPLPHPRLHRPDRRRRSSPTSRRRATCPDDLIGKTGVEATYEIAAARHVRRARSSSAMRPAARSRSSRRRARHVRATRSS